MGYTTASAVKLEFKSLDLTDTTAVTSAAVTSFIAQADAYIDSRLSRKFVTPITGDISLLIIQNISTYIVAQRIKEIMQVKQANPEVTQDVRGGNLRKLAEAMIDDILSGAVILPDAVAVGSGGVDSFNVRNGTKHVFKTDGEQF